MHIFQLENIKPEIRIFGLRRVSYSLCSLVCEKSIKSILELLVNFLEKESNDKENKDNIKGINVFEINEGNIVNHKENKNLHCQEWKNLNSLSLRYNNIDNIDYNCNLVFNNLINLKFLDLSHNNLKIISDLSSLQSLTVLDISFNEIEV